MTKTKKLKIAFLSLQSVVFVLTILPLFQLFGLYSFFSSDTVLSFAFISIFLSSNIAITFFLFLKASNYPDKKHLRFLWIYALIAFAIQVIIYSLCLNQQGFNLSVVGSFALVGFYGFPAFYIALRFVKSNRQALACAFLAPLLLAGILFVIIYFVFKFLLYNFGGIGEVSTKKLNSSSSDNLPIDMSGKASHIEHEGMYTHLVLNDGTRIQLSNWYSSNGEGTDYAGKKYVGLNYIQEINK